MHSSHEGCCPRCTLRLVPCRYLKLFAIAVLRTHGFHENGASMCAVGVGVDRKDRVLNLPHCLLLHDFRQRAKANAAALRIMTIRIMVITPTAIIEGGANLILQLLS
jgi:hypothetical protein